MAAATSLAEWVTVVATVEPRAWPHEQTRIAPSAMPRRPMPQAGAPLLPCASTATVHPDGAYVIQMTKGRRRC